MHQQNSYFFNRPFVLNSLVGVVVRLNLLKPTGCVMHEQIYHSTIVRSAYTVFMCFVFIWEQTATCSIYSRKWLVFTSEMNSVYSAVRTGSLKSSLRFVFKGLRDWTSVKSCFFPRKVQSIYISALQSFQAVSGPHPSFNTMCSGDLPLAIRRSGREGDHPVASI